MQEAVIGLIGVVLGLGGSTWTTLWTNRQNRRDLEKERLEARQEEASREIRQALISIHHLKGELSSSEEPDRHEELQRLIHTVDTHVFVLASAELRARLGGATQIMWYWQVLGGRPGHPVWHAVSDASECIGAYLRRENLPEEPEAVRDLRLDVEALEQEAEDHLDPALKRLEL
ncbi:hypothetical protein J7E87_10970 [Streptomyces sp. ISL-1]|uniref:hypothetical protein n=1 Tax=Streptomyces sp. ISL-1 TaxID=2817657 RepID=UPI001BEA1645|nr:hypothetical protein [Streptomyces sp. ISL-1]MBT2389929.1 hypothetical protein [Streptomyces sp. ISL-1]